MTKILTAHEPPPIPIRSFDWRAWVDGDEERGCGWGSTEVEALADLLNNRLGTSVRDGLVIDNQGPALLEALRSSLNTTRQA